MAVAPIVTNNTTNVSSSRAHGLLYGWIPQSWYAVDNGRGDRDRGRDSDRDIDLDDTRSFRRRYDDQPPLAPRIQVPFSVVVTLMIYMITQLVGGVWWAATLQSNLEHEIVDRAKEETRLWDGIQTYRAETNALRLEIARLTGNRNHPNERNGNREE